VSDQVHHEHAPSVLSVVEALLFASDEPITPQQIADILTLMQGGEDRPRRRSAEAVERAIQELNDAYRESGRAFRIVEIAGGYQFATRPDYGVWIGALMKEKAKRKLSVSALESLAVIAYRQPVTKPELEAIRGVNADYVIRTLLERNLITIVGRAATPGRPLLYGTTRDFLKHFGLRDLAELPKPREIDELLAEAEYEVEKRLLKEQELSGEKETAEDMPAGGDGDEKMHRKSRPSGEGTGGEG
jgi:segregation and condensation protein B